MSVCDKNISDDDLNCAYYSAMAANLPFEFNKYFKNRRQLRRILRETKQSFEEIRRSGYFKPTDEKISNISISNEDEEIIQRVIDQPVGIIVLGQRHWARACIVNELFGQPLLPTSPASLPGEQRDLGWRMVKFTYGLQTQISLALPNSYELVEKLAAYEQPWHTIPWADLELKDEARGDPALLNATLDIRLRHALLRDDVQVVVGPCPKLTSFEHIYLRCIEGLTPIVIYAIADGVLGEKEIVELTTLKRMAPKTPVFFICARTASDCELTESEQHARGLQTTNSTQWPFLHSYHDTSVHLSVPKSRVRSESDSHLGPSTSLSLFQQLCGLGFLSMFPKETTQQWQKQPNELTEVESELVENFENFPSVLLFIRHILQSHLVNTATMLNESHNRCLRMFILSAFDMTWDMLITPKRLEYARQREAELYESLMCIANRKQEEIRILIVDTINSMRDDIIEKATNHQFHGVKLPCEGVFPSAGDQQICTTEIQDLVLSLLNSAIAEKLVGSVEYLRESFVGTLERCLASLESSCKENGESVQASNALKQILNAAYQVEVTVKTSSSVLRVLWEKMKQLIQSLPWKTPPQIDNEWKKRVAADMLEGLSETRLAKSICAQFRERLKVSHEQFAASLRQLEALHSGRLERTEEQRIKVRKLHAPRIARYALESTSLRDVILHGMPQLGREIGRGQYGVVYACDSWAGYSPCALKSVVPPDDKHWNDLAMEFFYTRSIPEHDRIVQIRGSVIDHSYGGGTPAVLLIMERLQKDLYCAIKTGLDWMSRLQVALDVVQGIRYLHGQGLVHRDIKLKNVLLDKQNRGKISDLGFCKPEAMMSGSIVGTPIHMAPELFTGRYDSSVDVYAFGILFWYICAGHIRLPYVFEQCQSKDQLWNCVRKGARPERLTVFDDECWSLMEDCWANEPSVRPLLGEVEPRLTAIMKRYRTSEPPRGYQPNYMRDRRPRQHQNNRRRHVTKET